MSVLSQSTIADNISFSGVGIHTGEKVNMNVLPSSPNSGIIFKRTDLKQNNIVIPNFENVCDATLCTTVSNQFGVKVSTVEHLMAALFGEGIDNALVEINAPEVPILDGSAIEFVEAIRSAGIKEQFAPRKFVNVRKKVEIKDGEKYISIEPSKNDLVIDFEIVYENPLIRTRRKEFKLSKDELADIYNSRTFCLYEDIDMIKSKGLAKGGSLDNAIVVKNNEILNEDGLRSRHEFVYHKILDCLGDLMLSGNRILGHIKTSQGGHALTNKLLLKFFSDKSNWTLETGKTTNKNELSEKISKKTLSVSL